MSGICAAGRIEVRLDAAPACARCARGRGCGLLAFGSASQTSLACTVADGIALSRRDLGRRVQVELERADASWLLPFAVACGAPTLGLVAGAGLGDLTGASVGLAGGLLAWRWSAPALERWLARRPCAGPLRIVSVDP